MAGDWIKMRTDLLTSPKVVRMSSALNADRFRIAGGLLSVWSLFDAHSEDGILIGYDEKMLDELAAWSGFSCAMISVGWLLDNGESLELPRFEDHNGASAKRRAQDSDRKREGRKMSALEADKNRTREEKRREDISNTNVLDKPAKFDPVSLGDFMPTELAEWWGKWVKYRRERKLSTKEPTWKAQAEKLTTWGKEGHNPCEIIEASITNGWAGLFEPKQKFNGGGYAANQQPIGTGRSQEKASPSDRIRAQARVAIERLDSQDGGSNLYADDGLVPAEGNQ
jgi:hypothetical protein